MISFRKCLVALAIVFVAVQTVSSIKCWQCINAGDKCDTEKTNVSCPAIADACMSISTKDNKPYALGCVVKTVGQKECDTGILVNCKVCTGDYCNSSSFVAPSIFTITMFAAVITKMYF